MNSLNRKYFVFITSGGRTGTRFLGTQLSNIIDNSFSTHEPDVLTIRKGYNFFEKLKIFGFYHFVLGKLIGKTGFRNLSQNFLSGRITLEQLKKSVEKHRKKYYETIAENLIIESYSGWYGAIPAIEALYNNYKIVVILRDPKDWITSNMNWGTLFGKRDWVEKAGLGRLNPKLINDKKYIEQWKYFSRFEKLCWTYKTQYEVMLNSIKHNPKVIVVKFEALFDFSSQYETLNSVLHFISDFGHKKFDFVIPEKILDKQIHRNISYNFPKYDQWENWQKRRFKEICGDIARKINYEV